ncbi:MAG: hypothetical protein NC080_07480 [Paraprevotella sp.]|nr:hypothetical protein [Paraprevotella sp.]
MLDALTASDLISLGTALLAAFGTVLWALFRRVCNSVDEVAKKIDANAVKLSDWQVEEEKRMHEMELRIIDRIDRMDKTQDKMAKDIGVLYSRVGILETRMDLLHREE